MSDNKCFLNIENLQVIYSSGKQTVHAVNGVSLQMERGETLGLVGETGAGKTTLALSIMGLLPPRTGKIVSGSVSLDGLNLTALNDKDMRVIRGGRISMIFQDPMTALNPVLTVGDQLEESLLLHNSTHMSREQITARADEIFTLVGISTERRKQYPHEFSGGMKQRVVIAIALACDPELLIADEPTTALDVTIQAQVLALMDELKQKLEMSMLLITHDLGIVAKTCDKVAVMYAGEIVEYGTFEDFFFQSQHRHPYTDGLFRSIPNIESDERRLHPIEGLMPNPANLPAGCKFHPRCPQCTDRCKTENPQMHQNGTHFIKCHLYQEWSDYGA